MNDEKIDDNTIVLDLGDSVYSGETYSLSGSGIDTITIDPQWNTLSSLTVPTSSVINTGSYYTTNTTGTNYTWGSSNPSTVTITNNGIDMAAGTDIKVDGKSLKEFMKKMEQRLSILVPDPEKLEKFEALKKAYEHYKTMEALCFPENTEKED